MWLYHRANAVFIRFQLKANSAEASVPTGPVVVVQPAAKSVHGFHAGYRETGPRCMEWEIIDEHHRWVGSSL